MRILLAPMEGVIDHTMRELLTSFGGIDRCVTEFIRVTHTRLPARVFYRYCPELQRDCRTASGVPVYIQLLGGQPGPMADNAARAAALGAAGIDLNFGCPAKTVNRHDGGSVLLREPARVHAIVSAVRAAVPRSVPVTAKIRLGYDSAALFQDIAGAVVSAGADELTVHARTKLDGYRPPAHWPLLATLGRDHPIPVVANGEIWSPGDAERCRRLSGCDDLMLGRGALASPDLARRIRAALGGEPWQALDWYAVTRHLLHFVDVTEQAYDRRYVGNRIKQWLGYLRHHYPQGHQLFADIKRLQCPEAIATAIRGHRRALNRHRAA